MDMKHPDRVRRIEREIQINTPDLPGESFSKFSNGTDVDLWKY
ncbi:hypothetical protein CORAM0001_1709 [Corynebacterium amycolatum SK46]|nr:hypothetical protein CORAM0001_1709 [Corynebacterium amycolatum SK46]